MRRNPLSSLSLTAKICATATTLVVLSLAVTSAVIAVRSSDTAEDASMHQARTSAREAAAAVQAQIGTKLGAVTSLAAGMSALREADIAPSRPQIAAFTQATVRSSDDFIGGAVTFEPDALDGKDADYAGKGPEYDAFGRYMPYYTRNADGTMHVEPIVWPTTPGANDWYDIPKATRRVFFTEPYSYPVNGKDIMLASLVAPILVKGEFRGTASFSWRKDGWGAGAFVQYVGEVYDTTPAQVNGQYFPVKDWTTVSLYGQYALSDGMFDGSTIRIGARNVFDKDPPVTSSNFGYMGSVHNATGRYWYLNLSKRF